MIFVVSGETADIDIIHMNTNTTVFLIIARPSTVSLLFNPPIQHRHPANLTIRTCTDTVSSTQLVT